MTLDPDLKSRILQAVEDGFAEQVSFTQQLVQTPSLRGHEHAIQDLLFRNLQSRGYAMDRFKMDRPAARDTRTITPTRPSSWASTARAMRRAAR